MSATQNYMNFLDAQLEAATVRFRQKALLMEKEFVLKSMLIAESERGKEGCPIAEVMLDFLTPAGKHETAS